MEFYNSKLKHLLLIGGILLSLNACTSDEFTEPEPNEMSKLYTNNFDGSPIITLSDGEQIVLKDTTTYVMHFDVENCSLNSENGAILSRGIAPTGYDREVKPSDYKKYLLSGLEEWGISPNTIYVGKFVTYYKDLPVSNGYSIFPSNTKYSTLTTDCMGFNPPSLTSIGFHTTIPDTWTGYETGITQIFYVKTDMSGIDWNMNIPCDPNDLVWYYRQIENE